MTGALDRIRVLDLSRVLAGPVCTQILGDLGADIVKIEKPGAGDDTRAWGPPFLKDAQGNDTAESAYYLSANRNKRSAAIDLAAPEGRDLIHRLLAQSDVLIENFKTGGLKKYGLDFDEVHKRHPQIVYCSITGFGQNGPLSSEPGYDFVAQAMGGLMASTGEPGGEPMKAGVALSDVMTGLYAAIGILAALHHRRETGKGQHVDLALLDVTLTGMTNLAQYYLTSGVSAQRYGNTHSAIVPYQAFATSDGHVVIAVGNDTQFRRLCALLKTNWADDSRFAVNAARVKHRAALIPELSRLIAARTTGEWVDLFRAADIPAGPVNTMDQVFATEQVREREMQIALPHPLSPAPIHLVGSPLKMSETPVSYRAAPPIAGQHTAEILKELLGLDTSAINALKASGAIA